MVKSFIFIQNYFIFFTRTFIFIQNNIEFRYFKEFINRYISHINHLLNIYKILVVNI